MSHVWNRQDQLRPTASFWTRAEIELPSTNHPQTREFFDKWIRPNLKSKTGGRLNNVLLVNRVSQLKKDRFGRPKLKTLTEKSVK